MAQRLIQFVRAFSVGAALVGGLSAPSVLSGQKSPGAPAVSGVLTQAVQVLRLTSDEAGRHNPVQLRGVVTFFEQRTELCFVQDQTAGIYVYLKSWDGPVKAGLEVEIAGTTAAGSYSPFVARAEIKVIGHAHWPKPKPLAIEQLASGREDSQWVQVEGVIRRAVENWGHLVLDVASGSSRVKVRVLARPQAPHDSLVDSRVRVQGVVAASFDARKELGGFHLLTPGMDQVSVIESATGDPFATPIRTGRSLKAYSPGSGLDHRVHLRGTVTLSSSDRVIYIRDSSGPVKVRTDQEARLEPGDVVDISGFPVLVSRAPEVADAIFRKASPGDPPSPVAVAPSQALSGAFENELVKMEARLVAAEVAGDNYQTLFLRSDRTEFCARLQKSRGELKASRLTPGSLVQVTGICARENPENPIAGGFGLLLRSPQDLRLLELPPSPNSSLESWVLWGATLALVLGFGWLAFSMRRVEQRAAAIGRRETSSEEIQNEKSTRKTLEERERIARDLHDGIIQSIYAVGLNLENCKRLVTEKPGDVEGQLARVLSDLNGVIRDVRNFILGLESDTLRGQEFKTALKSIVLTLGEAHAPRFSLQIESLAAEHLTSHQATQLLHIAREAVSNSVRHARAERTVLSLQPHQGKVRFEVRDNGTGFDPDAVQSEGRGLRNIAARARDLRADFTVDSNTGQGTRIVLDIPVKNSHESA